MNENPNLPKKPVPKADIPNRSITSSITDKTTQENTNSRDLKEASGEPIPEEINYEIEERTPESLGATGSASANEDDAIISSENSQSRDCRGAGIAQTPESLHNCRGTDEANDPTILNDDEQSLFIGLFARGASPHGACLKLGISFEILQRTFDRDPIFRARREKIEQHLSQNVASALYKAAMEGNVTAQTHWLRYNPPENWRKDNNEIPDIFQNMEKLSDDDIKRLAIYLGDKIPEELA